MSGRLTRRLDWSGRASRREFVGVLVAYIVIWLAYALLMRFAAPSMPGLRYGFFVIALLQVVLVAVLVRRLHDAGRSGGWAWLLFVPVVLIAVLAYAVFAKPRPNVSGPVPGSAARKLGQVALGLFVLFVASRAFWAPYWIPAASMKPNLLVGDYIVVRHIGAGDARRGDVLVFRHPVLRQEYIKRLIGLPGDTVQMRDGQLWLNGQQVPQEDAGLFEETKEPQGPSRNVPRCSNDPVGLGASCIKAFQTESLPNGRAHTILDIDESLADNTPEFTVPEGHYFFMGDNRDNSLDSRFPVQTGGMGMVPASNVIGRATLVVYSTFGTSRFDLSSLRSDRFFKAVE